MVYIYGADVCGLPDPSEHPEVMEGLSEDRKNKILKCRQQKSRKESLGAGLLLKYAFNEHQVEDTQIVYGANGKPMVKGICFNLSHSHGKVICAVSEQPVGCDIEKIKEVSLKLADRFFCKGEIEHLDTFTGLEKEREFFRFWTLKESYMKLTGEGMKLGLDRFEILLRDKVMIRRDGEIVPCFIKEYDIPDYKVAVCAREAEFAEYVDVTKYLI